MPCKFEKDVHDDSAVSFILNKNVRGRFIRLDESLNSILSQHKYPDSVCNLICEAVLLTVMIGQALKLRWKLSIQIRGSGPVKLIAVDYFSPKDVDSFANVRAYSKFDPNEIDTRSKTNFHLLGKGIFAVLIDQGSGTEPYQGITPLIGDSLSDCAETYFDQSEQLPTSFKIMVAQKDTVDRVKNWRSGGIMLQQLPKARDFSQVSDNAVISPIDGHLKRTNSSQEVANNDLETWRLANILMNTVEEFELVEPYLKPSKVLNRLFHQEKLTIFEPQKLGFGCSCSVEKVIRTLSIYSSKDIKSMTTKEGKVTADCQFCGRHYVLNPSQLGFEAEK